MRHLIIGLGNPILGDDGVGIRVAEEVRRGLPTCLASRTEVTEASVGGLRLAEIQSVLELKDAGANSCQHTRSLLDRHLEELDDQIGRLTEARRELARAVLSGMTDFQRLRFDPALAPLRGDPVFEALVSLATHGADAMVDGRALGASPAGPAFEDLDALRAHFDAIENGAVRWRSSSRRSACAS